MFSLFRELRNRDNLNFSFDWFEVGGCFEEDGFVDIFNNKVVLESKATYLFLVTLVEDDFVFISSDTELFLSAPYRTDHFSKESRSRATEELAREILINAKVCSKICDIDTNEVGIFEVKNRRNVCIQVNLDEIPAGFRFLSRKDAEQMAKDKKISDVQRELLDYLINHE